jgi:ADP-ribose pyrophosphatase YjhB (NUDIX family)
MRVFRYLPAPLRRLAVRYGTPSYTVGAVLVLRRADGRILMVDQRHARGWALPGGLLRRSEDAVDGLIREVREEVGLRFERDQLPAPTALVDSRVRRVDLIFVVDSDDHVPSTQDQAEVLGFAWFALDELPAVTEPTRDILGTVPVA